MNKICLKCGEEKDSLSFSQNKRCRKDFASTCFECRAKNRKERIEKYRDKFRAATKRWAHSERGIEKTKEWKKINRLKCRDAEKRYNAKNPENKRRTVKKYVMIHPERERARLMVRGRIKNGLIKKQPCSMCGSAIRVQAHHDDYSKPLEVRWLCIYHHNVVHGRIKENVAA